MDEIMHVLISGVLYYSVGKPAIINYKLRRDFKLKGVNTATLPVEVTRKVNDIDEKRLLEQKFGSSIIEFVNIIKQNVPDKDLALFYNNFNNIKTRTRNFKIINFISGESISAMWQERKNTVELSPNNYKLTINHELLHAATTYIDPKTGIVFCGFQQIKGKYLQIGEGLNE